MEVIEAQVLAVKDLNLSGQVPSVAGTVRQAWTSREIGDDKQFSYPVLNELDRSVELALSNAGIDLENQYIKPIENDIEGKAAKEFRANLRKVIEALKKESTAEKNKILEEYNDFETKLKVTLGKLDVSDSVLKQAIDEYTRESYKILEKELEAYWEELTEANDINFYQFSKLGIRVMSSTSKNKEITKMTETIESIRFQKDLLFQTSPIAERVWAEFTNEQSFGYLDLKKSVEEVNRRIEIVRQEQEHAQAMERAKQAAEAPVAPVAPAVAPIPEIQAPKAPATTIGKPMKAPVRVSLVLTGDADEINLVLELLNTLNLSVVEVEQHPQATIGASLF